LQKLGEDTSTPKDATHETGADLQGMIHAMSTDEVLEHALASMIAAQLAHNSGADEAGTRDKLRNTCGC
jgi:hypothetical protein